jgi:CheY-like chemotaxis protein
MVQTKSSILVVDDNQDIHSVISDALEAFGLDLKFANNADEARQVVATTNLALVICDIKMPGQDGLSFNEQLRNDGFKVPFLFISGEVSDANSLRIERSQSAGLIRKPFRLRDIREAVRKIIG